MCVQVKEEISNRRSYGNTVVGGDTGVILCLCGGDTVAIFYLIVVYVCFGTDGALKARRHRSEQQQCTSGVCLWLCYAVSSSLRERLRCIAFSALSVVFMSVHVLGFCFASAASKWRISQGPEFGAGPEKIIGVS